eukprot:1913693-Rhodomonas_salina.2
MSCTFGLANGLTQSRAGDRLGIGAAWRTLRNRFSSNVLHVPGYFVPPHPHAPSRQLEVVDGSNETGCGQMTYAC